MSEIVTPFFWDQACAHLIERDRVMRRLIPALGDARLQAQGDAFTTLARSIIGQQISNVKAKAIWQSMVALWPDAVEEKILPSEVLKLDAQSLRELGIPARKADYLFDLARHFESGALHVQDWSSMDGRDCADGLGSASWSRGCV